MSTTASTTFRELVTVDDKAKVVGAMRDAANAAKAKGSRALFRVPVALRFDSAAKLQVMAAAIGVSSAALTQGVTVDLDDTAMSVGMLEHLRDTCPADADTCVVWLQAHWGRNVPMPKMPPMPGMPPQPDEALAVRAVGPLIPAGADAASTSVSMAGR